MSKKRKLVVDESKSNEQHNETPVTETVAETPAEPAKPSKPAVEWITTPNGAKIRPGTVMATQYGLFTLPAEEAKTFDEIVDILVAKHPEQSRQRHAFTVRRRSSSFQNKYGIKVGIDDKGRISTAIDGRVSIGRRLSPEQEAAKQAAIEERKAAKEAEKAAREAKKALKAAAKQAEKEAKEKAKAEAKAAAEAAKAAAAETPAS